MVFLICRQKLKKPYWRLVEVEGMTKELQASDYDFAAEEPRQTVVKPSSAYIADASEAGAHKESNVEVLVAGRKDTQAKVHMKLSCLCICCEQHLSLGPKKMQCCLQGCAI
jgi:hypothetical protein